MRTRRARWRPLRKSPNTAPESRSPRLEPPGRVQRGDAAGQIAKLDPVEPGGGDQLRQFALCRKAADAFDEIGVGVAIAGDDLAEPGQELEAVEVVERLPAGGHPRGGIEATK